MIISNLIVGTTYYFAATAYDNSNLESDYSNEAIYTNVLLAPPTIVLTSPANNAPSRPRHVQPRRQRHRQRPLHHQRSVL